MCWLSLCRRRGAKGSKAAQREENFKIFHLSPSPPFTTANLSITIIFYSLKMAKMDVSWSYRDCPNTMCVNQIVMWYTLNGCLSIISQ